LEIIMNHAFLVRATVLSALLAAATSWAGAADLNPANVGPATAAPAARLALKVGKPKVYDAVVSDLGVLQRGSASGASTLGAGLYQIDFPVDVTACTFVASQGTIGTGSQPDGTATTAQRAGVATAVFVKTHDTTGTTVNRSFHLAVICS
jgi:hypothetical protein